MRADSSTPLRADVQNKAIDDFKDLETHRTRRLELARDKLAGELWMLVLALSAGLILLVTTLQTDDRGTSSPLWSSPPPSASCCS